LSDLRIFGWVCYGMRKCV